MIAKEFEGSIKKIPLKKIRLHRWEYEWADTGGIINNDGPTMIWLLLEGINPDTRIGVSNLNYEIDKAAIAKFGNNVKDLFDHMSS